MGIDRATAESFVGKNVDITWDEPASQYQEAHEGCMGGLVALITDDGWLVLDYGYGILLTAIKRIEISHAEPEPEHASGQAATPDV